MERVLRTVDAWFGLGLTLGGVVTIALVTLLDVSFLVAILGSAAITLYGAVVALRIHPQFDGMRLWRIGLTANGLAFVGLWSVQVSESSLPSPELLLYSLAIGVAVSVDVAYQSWRDDSEPDDE